MDGQTAETRFSKNKRLLNARDYSRVFDDPDARASHQNLLLLARFSELPNHRLGLVIAKKNVRDAVQRNRMKRIAREVFRKLPNTQPSMDVVLLARRGMAELDNQQLSSILQQQWQKLIRHAANMPPANKQS